MMEIGTAMTLSDIVLCEKGVTLRTEEDEPPSGFIPWCDVITCQINQSARHHVDMTIHYIRHGENNVWREDCSTVSLEDEKVARDYCCEIRQRISKGRPRRLLVLINAIAGWGGGEAVYRSTVQPLMELAGVQCTVQVSKCFRHMEHIVTTCNLDDVDGILLFGGDGTYQEVIHALIPRVQKQHGVNYCDPTARLQPVPLPIGIVPTGTGNGLAQGAYGCMDVETAVLHVITGRHRPVNVVSVHASEQCVTYCGLVGSVGSWCDLQERADNLRWLGTLRHKVGWLSTYLLRNTTLDIEVAYLPAEGQPGIHHKSREYIQDCKLNDSEEWKTISGPSSGINVFPPCFYEDKGRTRLRWNQDGDGMLVVVEKPTNRWTYASWMRDMQGMLSKAIHYDFITHFHTSALKLRIKPGPDTSNTAKISVDGEIRPLDHTELHFRVHRNIISMFSSCQDLDI